MSRRVAGLALCLLAAPGSMLADVSLTTDTLALSFSDSGALVQAEACFPACNPADPEAATVRNARFGGGREAVIDPGLPLAAWTLTPSVAGTSRVLKFEQPSGASLTWRIPDGGYRLQLEIAGVPPGTGLAVRSGEGFRPPRSAGFGRWLEQIRYVALPGRRAEFGGDRASLDEAEPRSWQSDNWAGFRKRYWALLVRPDQASRFDAMTGAGRVDADLLVTLEGAEKRFDIYLGPVEKGALADADPDLAGLLYSGLWFWLRWICFALLWLLSGIHAGVATVLPPSLSWGISIMLLSLAVHVLMRPLARAAERLQDQVHAQESRLAPELSSIRRQYRGEQQAEAVLALYRREGVHPLYSLKSLLGVAIVIPVFIGAFDMLAENIHLAGTGFLWIEDLARPDAIARLPFELPFFGAQLNALPFLMTGLSIIASSLHRTPAQHPELRRKQSRNMLLLAAAFFVLFYTFPSGMVLYWTTNNLISAVKGAWRNLRMPIDGAEHSTHG